MHPIPTSIQIRSKILTNFDPSRSQSWIDSGSNMDLHSVAVHSVRIWYIFGPYSIHHQELMCMGAVGQRVLVCVQTVPPCHVCVCVHCSVWWMDVPVSCCPMACINCPATRCTPPSHIHWRTNQALQPYNDSGPGSHTHSQSHSHLRITITITTTSTVTVTNTVHVHVHGITRGVHGLHRGKYIQYLPGGVDALLLHCTLRSDLCPCCRGA